MTTDERNFRSSYYEKVGCRSVEEKKSLEILLKESPWDKSKLKQFCTRFTIPAAYRLILWKVQLGVIPRFPDSHEYVMSNRTQQFDDLLHALKFMKIVEPATPKPQVFLAMYMLETGRLHYNYDLNMESGMVGMVRSLSQMFDSDVDVYWLAKGFYGITEQFQKDIRKLVDHSKFFLEKEDALLLKFLQEKNAFDCLPFEKWFNCCFAGILDESALAKIWDKIVGGSTTILSSVASVLLITFRRNIMKCKDTEQILKCVQDMRDQTEEVIANKAIELWQQHGSMLPGQNESALNKPLSNFNR